MDLGDISNIESGLILSRKRARNELEFVAEYKVLSLNNIEVHGDFNEEKLEPFFSNDHLEPHYFTKSGEILLRLNEPFTSVYIHAHQAGVLIPSYFVSIEIQHPEFLPEYISWYLNTNAVKRKFTRAQTGTRTPNINQKIIRDLSIPKLPLKDQRNITGFHRHYLREQRFLKQLKIEKNRYYQLISEKMITKMGEY